MDTVYGTKKYFQSLSGVSDIYRAQTCRQMSADYTYQNTVGRRSQLGAYYHMNKQPSYTNEHSLNSQYGYNTWGIWRDGRNIAPSTFSAKTHTQYPKNRSFSIILTTAAFIVLLAVISIAGLAFYFSSIKTTLEDPVMGFEGSFRIAKGDLFSTGLKYNHTTTYKQKIDFYKRFVERSMMDNGLQPLRTDVWGFGEGPLIKVSFRVFLDVRKLPQNILSVEEYIKESLFLETSAAKSLYRSLRLDTESVEIKRIMDEQVVRSAAILKEAQTVPTSQTQLEKRLMKKGSTPAPAPLHPKPLGGNTTLKPKNPLLRSHSADEEPDIDVENAPVIQGSFEGSFEITKTDADIARKKTPPTRAYQASSSSTLPPKAIAVTPFSLRVKPKKPSIEKLTSVLPQQVPTGSPISTTRATTRATKATTTTTKRTTTSTTRKTTTTTTPKPTTTTPTTTTEATTTTTTSTTTKPPPPPPSTTKATTTTTTFTYPSVTPPTPSNQGGSLPKLDANLFTTFPILDTQPWRPMHREVPELLPGPPPAFPTKTLPGGTTPTINHIPQRRIDEFELPFIGDNPTPPTAAVAPVTIDPYSLGFLNPGLRVQEPKPNLGQQPQDQDMLFYHNFGSPIFMPGTENIERLGGALVEPHPLPVPLIDDVIIPPFKPIDPTIGTGGKLPFNLDVSNERFEHLGGGVIAKKPQEKVEKKEQPAKKEPLEQQVKEVNQTQVEKKDVQKENKEEQVKTEQLEITTKPVIKVEKVEVTTSPSKIATNSPPKPTKTPSLPSLKPTDNSVLADTIGEFFMELLNLPKEDNATATKKPTEEPLESRIEPEEDETQKSPSLSHSKPNFLNLKQIILQRNTPSTILSNATLEEETTTTTPTTTTSTTEEPRTTKRNRIRTTSERPTMMDDSNLFPSHSKWEFVNSSSTQGFGHNSNMRKVFNQTLQAWVSEDIDKSENLTLNDIKTRINNASNIQDISLIFDTLASKLGITPSVPNKFPPFSQNKLKQAPKEEVRRPIPTSTTPQVPLVVPESKLPVEREPFIKPMASFLEDGSSEVLGAAIPVIGEAEVEVVDPLNYEEMLKISQFAPSSTEPSVHRLVTLLPVRSNSGIRTYRPPAEDEETQRSASDSVVPVPGPTVPASAPGKISIRRKSNLSQSRRFGQPPAEAVVKGGIQVTVKK
ncbi:mucin-17 isoform X1 [Drosophila gunungcola]|uniref:mucin-17 isoform X1 n=2 Tax=Drosophila gunungcola TaxID=103775 RepID=UPI0022E2C24E|nr:mucin-17 isoform X1 [Drosophila gunungcola]XP_052847519.1 mucin-17 isoform X1 [Drosophila gunungcola]